MKRVNIIWTIILLMMAGCGGNRKSGNDSDTFITVDVTASYPQKELILQDFMDVEYVPLETSREFLCQGFVQAIGKNIIIVKNNVRDGDIFIFDRNGKGLRKINRIGQGGEEYTFILGITLDEDNNEIFVNDHYIKKILVYDLYGKFKRAIRYQEGSSFTKILNYDNDNLICYDSSADWEAANKPSQVIISKQDGSVVKEIKIPFDKAVSTILKFSDPANNMTYSSNYPFPPMIPYQGGWILVVSSSDTVFRYSPDQSMTPFIVRTPSIQSMNPEVFLYPGTLSEQYYFMESVKKEYNFETRRGFPTRNLMYDKQEKAIFEYLVYNDDYSNKRPVGMVRQHVINNEIAFWQKLEADHLFEAHEKEQLKGKLKEIAAKLEEEDNPVIMLVKYKK